jgi:hypothetical protein
MDEKYKILLNKEKSVRSVNVTSHVPLNLENSNKIIPLSNEQTVVNSYEQFEKERRECTTYRFYGTLNTMASNGLYNENVRLVNETTPNNITPNISGKIIPANSIFVNDGWYGYYEPPDTDEAQIQNDNESSICQFKTFEPGHNRLLMIDDDGKQNYLLKITYPFDTRDINLVENNNGISLKDGIQIIEKGKVIINNRSYVYFKTPINHKLKVEDEVKLYNFVDNTNNGLYLNDRNFIVTKLGDQQNNNLNRIFVIDINPNDIDLNLGTSTIKRVIDDVESEYYVRRLKSLTDVEKDYDIYPAAYGVNYFDDRKAGFYFKKDIDVEGLRDNLGRPLSELFFTIVKNDNDSDYSSMSNIYWRNKQNNLPNKIKNRFWMPIAGGYDTEQNVNVNYNIRAFSSNYPNGDPNYPQVYFTNLDESNEIFDNDIVEYNESLLTEIVLEKVFHRINTVYRQNLNLIDSNKVDKREGYIYNPHTPITIREFSDYIEEGDTQNTLNIPDYSHLKFSANTESLPTGILKTRPLTKESKVFRWRDLLEIGFIDGNGRGVEYPFESGAHYIYLDNTFYLYRQDPPCDVNFTSQEVNLPSEKDKFLSLVGEPTFYDYSVEDLMSILPGAAPVNLLDPNLQPTIVDIRFITYSGEYELGERDTPGGCVDYSSLEKQNITDDC